MNADLPIVQKPSSGIRCLGQVDIAPLETILGCLTENVWHEEDSRKPNNFACFHSTRHIIFRFWCPPDVRAFHSSPAWKIWSKPLLSVMNQAVAEYAFDKPIYPKAMLASLSAGRSIDRHIDHGGHPGGVNCVHKIHVPIRTEPGAVLSVNDIDHHLKQGYAYEVNNLLPHGALNNSTNDRVHFIFEVYDDIGTPIPL